MANAIIQTAENTFTTKSGNTELELSPASFGGWYVSSQNPSTRAWNGSMGGLRHFADLAAVEAHYKGFRGIQALINA